MLRLTKRKKDGKTTPAKQQALVLPLHTGNRSLDYLVELIKKIRPNNPRILNLKHYYTRLGKNVPLYFLFARPYLASF
jgi:hypothetical protein